MQYLKPSCGRLAFCVIPFVLLQTPLLFFFWQKLWTPWFGRQVQFGWMSKRNGEQSVHHSSRVSCFFKSNIFLFHGNRENSERCWGKVVNNKANVRRWAADEVLPACADAVRRFRSQAIESHQMFSPPWRPPRGQRKSKSSICSTIIHMDMFERILQDRRRRFTVLVDDGWGKCCVWLVVRLGQDRLLGEVHKWVSLMALWSSMRPSGKKTKKKQKRVGAGLDWVHLIHLHQVQWTPPSTVYLFLICWLCLTWRVFKWSLRCASFVASLLVGWD